MSMRVTHWLKPIPMRAFDWEACTDDYEPGHPLGHGRTEAEAIADLKGQLAAIARERSGGQCECEGGCLSIHGARCENKDGMRGSGSAYQVRLTVTDEGQEFCQRCMHRRASASNEQRNSI